jgi:hypothetical protein
MYLGSSSAVIVQQSPGIDYQPRGVRFFGIDSPGLLKRLQIRGHARAFNLDFALWSSVYIVLQGSQGAYAVFVVYNES